MELKAILTWLVFPVIAASQATNTITLDPSSNECGSTARLSQGSSIKLTSSGNAPKGYCGLLIYDIKSEDSKCRYPGVCARVDQKKITCDAKVVFTGIHFDKTESHSKELSCKNSLKKDICTQGSAMRVEVLETAAYSLKQDADKMNYGFNITVFQKCLERKETVYVEYVEDDYRAPNYEKGWHLNYVLGVSVGACICSIFLCILFAAIMYTRNSASYRSLDYKAPDLEEAWKRNYILGIVVACCLCSIFLVLLIVMKCYYKNKPYRGVKEDP